MCADVAACSRVMRVRGQCGRSLVDVSGHVELTTNTVLPIRFGMHRKMFSFGGGVMGVFAWPLMPLAVPFLFGDMTSISISVRLIAALVRPSCGQLSDGQSVSHNNKAADGGSRVWIM